MVSSRDYNEYLYETNFGEQENQLIFSYVNNNKIINLIKDEKIINNKFNMSSHLGPNLRYFSYKHVLQ